MAVVPYGVDADRFHPDADARRRVRSQLGVGPDTPLAAAAGRLVRKKGFEYLIDAMQQTPAVILAIAGDGTLKDEFHARAAALGVAERVRFLGDRSQDDVAALFAAADVIVAPSIRDDSGNVDGLPNVVMEALSSGTLLISTTAGGIGSVVEHERTGLIVPEKDAGAIARALNRTLADPATGQRIGSAARALATSRFGWDQTAAAFESAYDRARTFAARMRGYGFSTLTSTLYPSCTCPATANQGSVCSSPPTTTAGPSRAS